jgi:hypothetical protein
MPDAGKTLGFSEILSMSTCGYVLRQTPNPRVAGSNPAWPAKNPQVFQVFSRNARELTGR